MDERSTNLVKDLIVSHFIQIAGAGNRELTARDVRAAIDTLLAGVTVSRP